MSLQNPSIRVAEVVSNRDPKAQERLIVRVPGVHNVTLDHPFAGVWAHHCAPFSSASGDLPEKGEFVYVTFPDVNNPNHILWLGVVRSSYQQDENQRATSIDFPDIQRKELEYE